MRRLPAHAAVVCAVLVGAGVAPPPVSQAARPAADRWAAWVASEVQCPGGADAAAPARAQIRTMLCLVNYARRKQGLTPLAVSRALSTASSAKARAIARCGVFEHGPCDRAPDAAARAGGYTGAWGENLFFGTGRYAAPRVALSRWLRSPGHRRNLLHPSWRTVGIARRGGVELGSVRGAVVWVNQFGDQSAASAGT